MLRAKANGNFLDKICDIPENALLEISSAKGCSGALSIRRGEMIKKFPRKVSRKSKMVKLRKVNHSAENSGKKVKLNRNFRSSVPEISQNGRNFRK